MHVFIENQGNKETVIKDHPKIINPVKNKSSIQMGF